jgi:6,7-dimethyl-8-ribityllumazine synthase
MTRISLLLVGFLSTICDAQQPRIAIITSKFNSAVTQILYEDAMARFAEKDIAIADEDVFFVPGAIEIPVVASRLAQSANYDAILCLGIIGRDYISSQVGNACQKVALKYGIPVIFGIIVVEYNQETWKENLWGKMGMFAADAAIEMAEIMSRI